jgi:hypothetical protein
MTGYNIYKVKKILSDNGLANVLDIYGASIKASLPLHAAAALMEKESGGKNEYGNDAGGALSGYPEPVDESNFKVFLWLIKSGHYVSNGVGPAQITYPGFFTEMATEGLNPWVPQDNMFFGFRLLAGYKKATGTWKGAGTKYNGSTAYGDDLAAKVKVWKTRLAPAVVKK